ncbi:MAG: divalent-cation tolerance protein CutA [Candidatus Bathyarchaeia archaeon]
MFPQRVSTRPSYGEEVTSLEYVTIFTTAPTLEDCERIACALVEERLAACVSIIPNVKSVYWWEGKVDRMSEHIVMIKTVRDLFVAVKDRIRQLHPYRVPEVIAVPVATGSEEYLEWLESEVSPSRD